MISSLMIFCAEINLILNVIGVPVFSEKIQNAIFPPTIRSSMIEYFTII